MSLRLALLGTGAMADYQRAKFAAMEGVEVAACYDVDGAKAVDFARTHGITKAYDDLEALLSSAPHAVSCCLVDSLHYQTSLTVLRRGVPLFCEKPLANTLPRARELAELSSGPGAVAMVNLSKRNAPALHALKALLEDGRLGAVESIDAHYRQGWVLTKVWGDWASTPRWKWRLQSEFSTAGVVGDLGVHLMDALIFLFGAPRQGSLLVLRDLPSAMGAGLVPTVGLDASLKPRTGYRPAYVELDADLTFSVPCHFSVSWIDPAALDSFRISVVGSRAKAVLDLERSRLAVVVSDARGEREISGPPVENTYQNFIDAARRGRSGNPSAADALAAQEALEPLMPGVGV